MLDWEGRLPIYGGHDAFKLFDVIDKYVVLYSKSRVGQIWLPVDSKSTHPMFEALLVQDRFISILVTKSV